MSSYNCIQTSVPDDLALQIASCLQVADVCSLGCCSRFWKELCGADCLWEGFCRDRWPQFVWAEKTQNQSSGIGSRNALNSKGWKEQYVRKHNEMAGKAALIIDFVERALAFESIEVGNYLKAVELLKTLKFGFKDVQAFFFKANLNVLVNLVGVHYCLLTLAAPVKRVTAALITGQISQRQVCVQWWKLGRWFYGFRLRDELHSRNVTLHNLVVCNEEVLSVLRRGAIQEVIRVQIFGSRAAHSAWSLKVGQCRGMLQG